MSRPSIYVVSFSCDTCHAVGWAKCSDLPAAQGQRGTYIEILEIAEGFLVKFRGRSIQTTEFACSACRRQVS